MPRNSKPEKEKPKPRISSKDSGKRTKKKGCQFCKEKVNWIDYKDDNLLKRYISDRGKIRARRVTGNCVQHQRDIAAAVKTCRELALIPYALRMVTAKGGKFSKRGDEDDDRGPRDRGDRGDRESRPPRDSAPSTPAAPTPAEELAELGSDLVTVGADEKASEE